MSFGCLSLGCRSVVAEKDTEADEPALLKELVLQVRKTIGPFAVPRKMILIPDLPKTTSGKIMRRILRKVSEGQADQLGDLSTLADPSVVETIQPTA
ncbi:hypothetical protein JCM11251_007480 [Rhodosporidiobolus azoricus]